MKTYTTAQVAKITKRSPSVISKLCTQNKLPASYERGKNGRKTWHISVDAGIPNGGKRDKDALIDLVHKLIPKGGYHKKVEPKKSSTPMNLAQVITFLEFGETKRSLLLRLGTAADETTLEVLLGLV